MKRASTQDIENGEIGNGRKKEAHNGLPTQLTLDQIAIKIIYTFLLK